MSENRISEGWAWPLNARKAHYFQTAEIRSLCGGWLFAGERKPDDFKSPDDCAMCRKRLDALYAKGKGK